MSTLVIKNVPDALHARLKALATRNRRSVTQEVITLIEREVGGSRPVPKLPPLVKLKGGPLTIDEVEAAIAEGRE
jgi:plasmid stability protein